MKEETFDLIVKLLISTGLFGIGLLIIWPQIKLEGVAGLLLMMWGNNLCESMKYKKRDRKGNK